MMKYLLVPERKNVLISGASGFIGGHLSSHLEKRYNVFNLMPAQQCLPMQNRIILDLRDPQKAGQYFARFGKRYRIDIIVHLASRLAPASKIEEMSVLYDNLKIAESIVEIAKLLKPKKIINFSSMAVYPNKDGSYSETSQVNPSANAECLYGLSKFCSEVILDFKLRKEKIIISHLRLSQVYGQGMRQDRIIPIMRRELKEKNAITVFGQGQRISNFIAIEKLLEKVKVFMDKDLAGIYNIGDEHLSYLELAQRLIRQYGDNKSRIIKKPEGLRCKVHFDTTKMDAYKESLKVKNV